MNRPIFLALIFIIAAIAIGFVFLESWNTAGATAENKKGLSSSLDQVKVFRLAVANEQQRSELETKVNDWLKENEGKIEVMDVQFVQDQPFIVVIKIWYKVKAE